MWLLKDGTFYNHTPIMHRNKVFIVVFPMIYVPPVSYYAGDLGLDVKF